jgi:TolB protein
MKHGRLVIVGVLLTLVVLLTGSLTASAAAAGTGPDDALAPSGEWEPLKPGKSTWYAFQYAGDGSQIQIRMEVEPVGGAKFDVWTPKGVERWRLGLDTEPVGSGSQDPHAAGALIWSGSFNDAGTYYVVVEHASGQPGTSYYLLTIRGNAGSLSTSPPASTATPEPTKSKPKPAAPSAPTGKLVFQTSMGGDFYTINVDGSSLQRITDGMDPVWSPSGQQIAFVRWRDPRGVWVVDADGGSARRIFDWSEARYPSWSPDGTRTVFSRRTGGTEERELCFRGRCFTIPAMTYWKLGIVNAVDGTFAEPLPTSDVSQTPDWSPAGTPGGERIVYDGDQGLVVQSVDGQDSYEITRDARDTSPDWSPTGDQVAFVRRQHDHWEIYVVNDSGSNVRRLTDTPERPDGVPGNSVAPAWSPDGNYIAFLTDRTGQWEIWVMAATGSNPRPLFPTALDGLTLDYGFVADRVISWTR